MADSSKWAPMLGCIADDLTGATDLASRFAAAGLTVQLQVDAPGSDQRPEVDVVVIGTRSRMKPPSVAAAHSLTALDMLRSLGIYVRLHFGWKHRSEHRSVYVRIGYQPYFGLSCMARSREDDTRRISLRRNIPISLF